MENTTALTLGDLIAQQGTKRAHSSDFVTFTSKKTLSDSAELAVATVSAEVKENLKKLANISSVAVHKDSGFAAITLYVSSTKTYTYLIINLADGTGQVVESVKVAKETIRAEVLKAAASGIAPDKKDAAGK